MLKSCENLEYGKIRLVVAVPKSMSEIGTMSEIMSLSGARTATSKYLPNTSTSPPNISRATSHTRNGWQAGANDRHAMVA